MIRTRTIKAYAKINLYLDVTGKRQDGYHNISSIMQQISLFDYVTVMKTDTESDIRRIAVTCTDRNIPTDESNIVHKCAKAFFDHFGIEAYNIKINIDKRIPQAAGLAGGSTDGAAVLKMLPVLFDIRTDPGTLCRIGSKVGADIPFCLMGGTCLASGIGEELTPVNRSFSCPVLVAIGSESVSTPEAYRKIDEKFAAKFADGMVPDSGFMSFLHSAEIPRRLYNIFESVILPTHGEAAEIRQEMLDYGAKSALMSGSGPSVFGLFESEHEVATACDHFNERGIRAYKCKFIN